MQARDVDYRCGETSLRGYLALDENAAGKRPGVAVFHEGLGLGEFAMERARGRAALETLAALPQVDAGRLAAIGFCFGGSVVLELARAGAELKAVVSFHGVLATKMPAQPGLVKASVLVCTGVDDPLAPPE